MIGESVATALSTLRAERDRLDSAISSLESLVGSSSKSTGPSMRGRRGRRRGRPPGSVSRREGAAGAQPLPARRGKRKKAPKGLLKSTIYDVLKAAKKPLKPVDLREGVIKAGYPNKNLKTLYTSIFTTAKADTRLKKTDEGFSLR